MHSDREAGMKHPIPFNQKYSQYMHQPMHIQNKGGFNSMMSHAYSSSGSNYNSNSKSASSVGVNSVVNSQIFVGGAGDRTTPGVPSGFNASAMNMSQLNNNSSLQVRLQLELEAAIFKIREVED